MNTARQLAGWRRRKRKKIPAPVHAFRDRRHYAELYTNRALYDPPEVMSPEEILIARERMTALRDELAKLPPREERVLRLHYGLDDRDPQPFYKIGEAIGITGGRTQQIHWKAIRRIKVPWRLKNLDNPHGDTRLRHWRDDVKAQPNLYVPHWRRAEIRAAEEKARKKAAKAAKAEAKREARRKAEQERADREGRASRTAPDFYNRQERRAWNSLNDLRSPRNAEQARLMKEQEQIAILLEQERAVLADMRLRAAAMERRERELLEAKARERRRAETQRIEAEEREIRRQYVQALNALSGHSHHTPEVRVIYERLGMTPPTPEKHHG